MIKILIVGLPGNMATIFAKHAIKDDGIDILNYSITGNETEENVYEIDGHTFNLIKANDKAGIKQLFENNKDIIAVDYTEPHVVENNIDLYCRKKIDFIVGTTGVAVAKVSEKIRDAKVNAVIAPNMGKQIVAIQAMVQYAAENFPNCFKGYNLTVTESHQKGKMDTSGTARAMVEYFNKLGMSFNGDKIIKYRDPKKQLELGVPKEHLSGHGWHTYAFTSDDESVHIEITHNVNGRDIYADGTIDSIYYLYKKIESGVQGTIFSMIDVLKNE